MSVIAAPTRLQSIALRVSAAMALVLAITVLVTIGAAYQFGRSAADEAFDRLLKGAAFQIAERVVVIDGTPVVDIPASAFELLSLARNDRIFYRVIGPDGATLTGYDDLPVPDLAEAEDEFIYETTYRGVELRALLLKRLLAERSVSGQFSVVVAQTTDERAALARNIAARSVIIILVVGLALLVLALGILRIALRPLVRIERAILGRDANDLSPLNVSAPREVAALVSAIDRFMGRLESRIRAMQEFVADAAHQIRTPITALSAQAQLALNEHVPIRLQRLHRRIHSRSVGLGRLADQLLSHAMVSHRAETAAHDIADLRRVAVEAEREMRSLGEDGDDNIVLDLPDDDVPVRGDKVSLREAVKNLIDNANKHGKKPVRLSVSNRTPDHAIIAVADSGAGIAPELAGKIGERFAHSGVGPESAGLGLSIVSAVATSHKGRLAVERPSDGGFEVALLLPAAKR